MRLYEVYEIVNIQGDEGDAGGGFTGFRFAVEDDRAALLGWALLHGITIGRDGWTFLVHDDYYRTAKKYHELMRVDDDGGLLASYYAEVV